MKKLKQKDADDYLAREIDEVIAFRETSKEYLLEPIDDDERLFFDGIISIEYKDYNNGGEMLLECQVDVCGDLYELDEDDNVIQKFELNYENEK